MSEKKLALVMRVLFYMDSMPLIIQNVMKESITKESKKVFRFIFVLFIDRHHMAQVIHFIMSLFIHLLISEKKSSYQDL